MDIQLIRQKSLDAIAPVKAAAPDKAFWGQRSEAGRSLPPYYLVYFLLVDLLGFEDLGREEKVAFSIPVEIDGKVLMIQHRKFGLGIFIKDLGADEVEAEKIAERIRAGVKAAQPYFDALADNAAHGKALNVQNNSRDLFGRFSYFAKMYAEKSREAAIRKGETIKRENYAEDGSLKSWTFSFPAHDIKKEARWLAIAAIECFYSWTEHVFILIAILRGQITTGEDVAKIAAADWKDKFKLALDITDPRTKSFYDQLTTLRSQVRNFVAHGAFGKNGQALSFHSPVGAVPLLLPHRQRKDHFRFGNGVDFLPPDAMELVNEFIDEMWKGPLSPAKIYIDADLPLILSYVENGMYSRAMTSDSEMTDFTDYLSHEFDNAANMDW